MTCPVALFLAEYDNGDREQLEVVINDPTRHSQVAAILVRRCIGGEMVTGADILKHRHQTCDCFGWQD